MRIKTKKKVPQMQVDLVNDAQWSLSEQSPEHFTMVVFYRGLHCPVCKSYLEDLQERIGEFSEKGIYVIAVSADNKERAKKAYAEWEVMDVPIGYGYPIEAAEKWGLYVSERIKEDEPDRFFEPGLFLIRPNGTLYSASIQSMPFARPNFADVLKGLSYIIKEDYPARGAT
jgi:peroxiredoxin